MHTITICNQKGGVAKTTTALNLACGLALLEHRADAQRPGRVLLVDMDPQGNASTIASSGLFSTQAANAPDGQQSNLANLLVDDAPPPTVDLIHPARIPTLLAQPNLDYLTVHRPDMTAAARALATIEASEFRLADGLSQVGQLYRYTIVDTGPGYGEMLLNALTAADFVIIPVELTGLGLTSIPDTLGTIRKVQKRLNRNLKLLGILPSKCNLQRSEAKAVLETLHNEYPALVFEPIRERAEVSVANTEGLDIFSYRPPRSTEDSYFSNAPTVQEYARLVQEVVRRIQQS